MRFILALLFILIAGPSLAQVRDTVSGLYSPGLRTVANYIQNPFCFANTQGISVSGGGAVSRTTTTPLHGTASCLISSTTAAGKIVFATRTLDNALSGRSCEVTFSYSGNGANYKVYAERSGVKISQELTLVDAGTGSREGYFLYPCGDLSAATTLVFEALTTPSAGIRVGNVQLGAANRLVQVSQARIAGESYFAGTSACTWSRTSSTLGALTATSACPGPTIVNSTVGQWQTTDADLPRQTINNLPAGTYKAKFLIYHNPGASGQANAFAINDGTTTCEAVGGSTFTTEVMPQLVECTFVYSSAGNRVFELYVGSVSSSIIVRNSNTAPRASTKFILEYFPNESQVIVAPDQSNYDWSSYTPTFTGFGTVTSPECQHKRDGSDLLLRCKFVAGTTSATEARVSLPTGLIAAGTDKIPTIQKVGDLARSISASSNFSFHVLQEPSVAYVTFGVQSNSTGGLTKAQGSALIGNTETASFLARIPIAGWVSPGTISALIEGYNSTPGIARPLFFSAYVSDGSGTTTVSREMGEWINGNCTNPTTSNYVCTFTNAFAQAPSCFTTADNNGNAVQCNAHSETTTQVSVKCSDAGSIDSSFKIACHGYQQ